MNEKLTNPITMEELEALDENMWFSKIPNLDGTIVELGKLIVKDYWLMIYNAIQDQSFSNITTFGIITLI
jgi:hypothetical protein